MDKKTLVIIIAVVVVVAVVIYLLFKKHFITAHTTTTSTITTPTTQTSPTQTSTSPTSTSSTSSSGNIRIIENPCSQILGFVALYLAYGVTNETTYALYPGQSIKDDTTDWSTVTKAYFVAPNGQQIPANVSGNVITPAYCPSS